MPRSDFTFVVDKPFHDFYYSRYNNTITKKSLSIATSPSSNRFITRLSEPLKVASKLSYASVPGLNQGRYELGR